MDAASSETTFHYRQVRAFCLWTTAVDILVLIVVVGLVRLGRRADGLLFGVIFLTCFTTIGWFLVSSMADVVVNEAGVSRRLWGRTLRNIGWGNIQKIRVFSMYHRGYGRKVRVFSIYPATPKGTGLRLLPRGQIGFNEPADISALIEHMNRYIAEHGIPVEVQVGTSWNDAASWSTRNRIDPTCESPGSGPANENH